MMMEKIAIQNLKCSGCGNTIKSGLEKVEGISNVEVHVEEGAVSFQANEEQATLAAKEKLNTMGYPPVGENNTMGKKAKSYVSCAIGKMS